MPGILCMSFVNFLPCYPQNRAFHCLSPYEIPIMQSQKEKKQSQASKIQADTKRTCTPTNACQQCQKKSSGTLRETPRAHIQIIAKAQREDHQFIWRSHLDITYIQRHHGDHWLATLSTISIHCVTLFAPFAPHCAKPAF